jgi:opine dehydrogenase
MEFDLSRAAVIGAGAIGCATAGYLSHRGMEVSIYDVAPAAIDPIRSRGRVRLLGALDYEAEVARATTDISEALEGASFVITCVPASVHEAVARSAAPHLADGTLLLIQPGQTLSSVAFLHAVRAAGFDGELTPVETLSALFAATLVEPGTVDVHGLKHWVPYAALPARRTAAVGAALEPLLETLSPWGSTLEIGLHNPNAVMHPPVTMLNVGIIDRAAPFRFYADGATPKVMQLVEASDRERLAVLEALGLPGMSLNEWLDRAYGYGRETLYETTRDNVPYHKIPGPTSMNTRLLLEDIPTGLVPFCSIAEAAGVPTPTMRAIVRVCSLLYGVDFFETGHTLERLGLKGLDKAGVLAEIGP